MRPLIGPDAADAASSRASAEPAGKPAIPVRRAGAEPGAWFNVVSSSSSSLS
ncbi:hypothetical protein [Thiohalocapsa sp. ML1]|uniref:hypothetical protein n=1 Tax=Thiohalocapsa sp. ML1 TaxID=1431688 RepID=UPI00138F7D47|nr:hypothetical protein [Thiohalocapsa sp. ML1]